MVALPKRESLALFVGDIFFLTTALWATLFLRYGALPEFDTFYNHLTPFLFLFLISALVFFIAGLYDKHAWFTKGNISETIIYAQFANILLGAVFFFLVPYFGIQPKTNLFIYLLLSSTFVIVWRLYVFPLIRPSRRIRSLLIGSGEMYDELEREVDHNEAFPLVFTHRIRTTRNHIDDIRTEALHIIREQKISVVVLDVYGRSVEQVFPEWYELVLSGVQFIDVGVLYERVFDRIPLVLLEYGWFIQHAFAPQTIAYSVAKRIVDIGGAVILGALSLFLYPFIIAAIKYDDGGPVFFTQTRIGKDNKPIFMYKFRSMSTEVREKVTRVGWVLRRYRLDELPQLWNVFTGDLSLIGPRPESPRLVEGYASSIPFYNTRHLVQPGLSGWAQIKEFDAPKGGVLDVERTEKKLSYDLYYIKHRSFLLDIEIALKTVRALLMRSGT